MKEMTAQITHVEWDTDGEEVELPQKFKVIIPEYIFEEVDMENSEDVKVTIDEYLSDEISNIQEFCHFGFSFYIIE